MTPHRVCAWLLLAFVLVVPGVALGADGPRLSEESQATLSAFLQDAIARENIPGVVVTVVSSDRVLYRAAFGKAAVARNAPMSPDAIFRIASMTKPLTSTAVMMLVEAGKVRVDDPVSRYLPAFAAPKVLTDADGVRGTFATRPAATPMTVGQLLTHTSGIGYSWSDPALAVVQRVTGVQNDSELPLVHDPGVRWTYGASTRVLGDLVQVVTGERIDAFLATHVTGPLGMTDTAFDVPASKHGRVVTVHQRQNGHLVEVPNPSSLSVTVRGDGGLYSTADDYGRFLRMILNGGRVDGAGEGGASQTRPRLLSATTVASMARNQIGEVRVRQQPVADLARSRPYPTGAGRDTWGFGFQIAAPRHDGRPARRAGSLTWAGINNTHFWIDRASNVGVIVLMQLLPFYDPGAMRLLSGFEEELYRQLW